MGKPGVSNLETELTGNFILDIGKFADLSREVGYQNCVANRKDEDGQYDTEEIDKYEALRLKQLIMQESLTAHYEDSKR